MGTRKCILLSSVVVVWLISGCLAHSLGSGRTAKILEEPNVPQGSYEVILQDPSDRSLRSVEHNMMLYHSVFTLSLKLLTVFVVVRLLTFALTRAGILKQTSGPVPIVPFPGDPNLLYNVDVNHNPGLALAGNTLVSGVGLHATSTGAAAGASTGNAPLALAPVPASSGVVAAGTNPRPSFLAPLAPRPPPRFRFGFRHPPPRRPPHHLPPQYYNMGEETQYIDTHSHLFVMPDGSQARVPISQTPALPQAKPASTSSSNAQEDSKSSASSTDATTERAPVESVNVSTSSSSSSAAAERRSSSAFSGKSSAGSSYLHQMQYQPYDDWTLHYSPGA